MTDEEYIAYVNELFRILRDADLMGESTPLIWTFDGDHVIFHVMCSDMFFWASADAEVITLDDMPLLRQTLNDLRAVGDYSEVWLGELFCCRKRGMRPMNAWFKLRAKSNDLGEGAWMLFEAAGPERESTWQAP